MPLKEVQRAHWRLAILRLLADGGHSANASVLYDCLPHLGLKPSRAQVGSELQWLGEQDLVRLEERGQARDKLVVASITTRGLDVARGRSFVEGVKPPSPEM